MTLITCTLHICWAEIKEYCIVLYCIVFKIVSPALVCCEGVHIIILFDVRVVAYASMGGYKDHVGCQ